jgi:hypothetical protein
MVHLFSNCPETLALWALLKTALSPNLLLTDLDAKFALLGFYEATPEHFNLVNHILLLFKLYVYQSRSSGTLRLNGLLGKITDTAKLEIDLSPVGSATHVFYETKWRPLNSLL